MVEDSLLKKRIRETSKKEEFYIWDKGNIRVTLVEKILDEAKQDMPKHYVCTDYTHDFGIDPVEQPEEFKKIKDEDYPRYVHIPNDEEWLKWAKKWFGNSSNIQKKSEEEVKHENE